MQKLATLSMRISLEPAPTCQISQDGSQILMGDWTKNSNMTPDQSKKPNGQGNGANLANKSGLQSSGAASSAASG